MSKYAVVVTNRTRPMGHVDIVEANTTIGAILEALGVDVNDDSKESIERFCYIFNDGDRRIPAIPTKIEGNLNDTRGKTRELQT